MTISRRQTGGGRGVCMSSPEVGPFNAMYLISHPSLRDETWYMISKSVMTTQHRQKYFDHEREGTRVHRTMRHATWRSNNNTFPFVSMVGVGRTPRRFPFRCQEVGKPSYPPRCPPFWCIPSFTYSHFEAKKRNPSTTFVHLEEMNPLLPPLHPFRCTPHQVGSFSTQHGRRYLPTRAGSFRHDKLQVLCNTTLTCLSPSKRSSTESEMTRIIWKKFREEVHWLPSCLLSSHLPQGHFR